MSQQTPEEAKQVKLGVNLAACEVLNKETDGYHHDQSKCWVYQGGLVTNRLAHPVREFDIFADAPQGDCDRDQLAKALRDNHGMHINRVYSEADGYLTGYRVTTTGKPMFGLGKFKTLEKALSAAIQAVGSE